MRYKTSRLYDIQYSKQFAQVDVKFTKSFLNDALVIGVYANDLFKTDKERWTMYKGKGAGNAEKSRL